MSDVISHANFASKLSMPLQPKVTWVPSRIIIAEWLPIFRWTGAIRVNFPVLPKPLSPSQDTCPSKANLCLLSPSLNVKAQVAYIYSVPLF